MATIIDPSTGEEHEVPYVSFEDEDFESTNQKLDTAAIQYANRVCKVDINDEKYKAKTDFKEGANWQKNQPTPVPKITRVEVIDSKGRSYVNMNVKNLELSYQDDGRTLKLFIK